MGKHRKLPDIAQLERENEVMKLRAGGMNWTAIAQRVGYKDHTGAIAAYRRAMNRFQEVPREEARATELDRIDRLQLAAWPAAMRGDLDAIRTALKCIHERCKITGIYEATKHEIDITTWDGGDSIDRAVRDLANLLAANAQNSAGESPMDRETSEAESTTTE